jgi:hypothetical protein
MAGILANARGRLLKHDNDLDLFLERQLGQSAAAALYRFAP